jgi:amino acid transporter
LTVTEPRTAQDDDAAQLAALGLYQFYGFEAGGDVAEEVRNPSARIPRNMRLTIYVGGAVAIMVVLGFIPAADVPAVVAGEEADPIGTALAAAFGDTGIYIAFQMVVFAALRARRRGWEPSGAFTLGRYGLAVNVAALVYGVAAGLNLAWPRTPDVPWYDNWIVILSTVVVVAVGLLYMLAARPWEKSAAAAGDAVKGGA